MTASSDLLSMPRALREKEGSEPEPFCFGGTKRILQHPCHAREGFAGLLEESSRVHFGRQAGELDRLFRDPACGPRGENWRGPSRSRELAGAA